jgi:hypothetical protein
LASLALVMALSGILFAVGFMRMIRFRRENPIPDEWRQVPRSSWPPAPGQRPRLP